MFVSVQALAEEALKLSAEDREALVERLVASLERAEGLSPEWRAEVSRRLADVQAGRTQFVPAEEALSRLAAQTHRHRPSA